MPPQYSPGFALLSRVKEPRGEMNSPLGNYENWPPLCGRTEVTMSEVMTDNILVEQQEEEDTMRNKFLIFHLDGQEYAIAIQFVVDIINVQPVTRVPNCPFYVRGITNLRGKVIPIIDVRIRFGKQPQEYNDRTCIIVVELSPDISVGMIIDSVSEVLTLDDDDISPPPPFSTVVDARFIEGIAQTESGIKLILDCKTVLDDNYLPVQEDK